MYNILLCLSLGLISINAAGAPVPTAKASVQTEPQKQTVTFEQFKQVIQLLADFADAERGPLDLTVFKEAAAELKNPEYTSLTFKEDRATDGATLILHKDPKAAETDKTFDLTEEQMNILITALEQQKRTTRRSRSLGPVTNGHDEDESHSHGKEVGHEHSGHGHVHNAACDHSGHDHHHGHSHTSSHADHDHGDHDHSGHDHSLDSLGLSESGSSGHFPIAEPEQKSHAGHNHDHHGHKHSHGHGGHKHAHPVHRPMQPQPYRGFNVGFQPYRPPAPTAPPRSKIGFGVEQPVKAQHYATVDDVKGTHHQGLSAISGVTTRVPEPETRIRKRIHPSHQPLEHIRKTARTTRLVKKESKPIDVVTKDQPKQKSESVTSTKWFVSRMYETVTTHISNLWRSFTRLFS